MVVADAEEEVGMGPPTMALEEMMQFEPIVRGPCTERRCARG